MFGKECTPNTVSRWANLLIIGQSDFFLDNLFLYHLNRLHFIWAIARGFLLLLTQSFDKITTALKSQHCSCSPYCLYYLSKKIEALSPEIPQFFSNSFKLCCVLVLPCLRETPTWFIFKKTIRSLSTFVKLFLLLTLCFLFTLFYLFLFSFFFVWADWVFFIFCWFGTYAYCFYSFHEFF